MIVSEKFAYSKYSPDTKLSRFVICYYFFEAKLNEINVIQSPPTSYSAFIFKLKDSDEICSGVDNNAGLEL